MFGRQGQVTGGPEVVFHQQGVGLLVGESLLTANDGVGEGATDDPTFGVKREEDGLGEPILRLDQ